MANNTTELLSLIIKAMSEKGIEVTKVEIYEEAVEINNKVKVCIGYGSYITCQENETGGRRHWSDNDMLIKVLELLTEDDWLPGDDIEAYGEWYTLVVEDEYYRLLDKDYSLSDIMDLEYLQGNYTNASLEKRLK